MSADRNDPMPSETATGSLPSSPMPRDTSRTFSPFRLFAWSVRRELWQHRSIWLAPALIGLFFVGAALIAALNGPDFVRQLLDSEAGSRAQFLAMPLVVSAEVLRIVGFILAAGYAIGAFYSERRDRSILFWKSMPVPDSIAAISKAAIPLLVVPLITLFAILATHALILLIESIAFAVAGAPVETVWRESQVANILPSTAMGIVFQVMWQAPIYGFLLLISSWASRVPVLFVILAPIGAGIVESYAFGTTWIFDTVKARFTEGFANVLSRATMKQMTEPDAVDAVITYLTAPSVWVGLLVAAGLIACTVWMRRRAEPL